MYRQSNGWKFLQSCAICDICGVVLCCKNISEWAFIVVSLKHSCAILCALISILICHTCWDGLSRQRKSATRDPTYTCSKLFSIKQRSPTGFHSLSWHRNEDWTYVSLNSRANATDVYWHCLCNVENTTQIMSEACGAKRALKEWEELRCTQTWEAATCSVYSGADW